MARQTTTSRWPRTRRGGELKRPDASASGAPAKVGEPIPAIDPKLPVEKLDLAAFSKQTKEQKAALVGKKLRLEGTVHSVSNNAMIFDREQALWGPEKEGTPNGVYAIELHGKKAASETWSTEVASCFVDEKTQKEISGEFFGGAIRLQVEGVVNRTFNDLAPCRVISKKVTRSSGHPAPKLAPVSVVSRPVPAESGCSARCPCRHDLRWSPRQFPPSCRACAAHPGS